MRVFAVGGEGVLRVFRTLKAAKAAAKASVSCVLEAPPRDFMGASGVPTSHAVAGEPSKVWVVVCGDGGCVNGWVGAFLDQAEAEKVAAAAGEKDELGLSYWASELVVEG